jgi:hypothetical protein
MIFLFFPVLELVVLYFLSRMVFSRISQVLRSFIRKSNWSYYLLAALFFPGTYIHELSHYGMAKLLFVRTFAVSFKPKIEGNLITLGSVEIAKTDFIRRFLIGAAPFLFGSIIVIGSMYMLYVNNLHTSPLAIAIEIFLVFEIGNTMFMSKRDLEGSWKVLVCMFFLFLLFYILGFDLQSVLDTLSPFTKVFEQITLFLAIPIVIDIVLILFLSLFI